MSIEVFQALHQSLGWFLIYFCIAIWIVVMIWCDVIDINDSEHRLFVVFVLLPMPGWFFLAMLLIFCFAGWMADVLMGNSR